VTLRARWVTLRARWVTLRARWVSALQRDRLAQQLEAERTELGRMAARVDSLVCAQQSLQSRRPPPRGVGGGARWQEATVVRELVVASASPAAEVRFYTSPEGIRFASPRELIGCSASLQEDTDRAATVSSAEATEEAALRERCAELDRQLKAERELTAMTRASHEEAVAEAAAAGGHRVELLEVMEDLVEERHAPAEEMEGEAVLSVRSLSLSPLRSLAPPETPSVMAFSGVVAPTPAGIAVIPFELLMEQGETSAVRTHLLAQAHECGPQRDPVTCNTFNTFTITSNPGGGVGRGNRIEALRWHWNGAVVRRRRSVARRVARRRQRAVRARRGARGSWTSPTSCLTPLPCRCPRRSDSAADASPYGSSQLCACCLTC
jgi:hypothetical protein